ncbi:hypothetical protein [Nesterenkonia sandarakina]|uniref:Uncharacterized protein n=1 Tax=Nesterenkonia sandarakina TaxID=272918 RepID=A0A2T0YIY0_9MICC|nr:hypothetical protein [Nesterenkonia sandarakina]PRZ15128.1 hypothetical protein BCL67_10949 [Nesterenkonia sandarakina]
MDTSDVSALIASQLSANDQRRMQEELGQIQSEVRTLLDDLGVVESTEESLPDDAPVADIVTLAGRREAIVLAMEQLTRRTETLEERITEVERQMSEL